MLLPKPSLASFEIHSHTPLASQTQFIPPLHACRALHAREPLAGVYHHNLPCFIVKVDAAFDILLEADHPHTHADLAWTRTRVRTTHCPGSPAMPGEPSGGC
ncbi:hypothetical protein C8Q79DRAFT_975739 [Trametes meyenii]|nr:hypothetical protein C8Q79DRAFT_975739 [Trametes meyenii]